MASEFSGVLCALSGSDWTKPVEGRLNFLNEGCEYLDLELGEADAPKNIVAMSSESAPIRVDSSREPNKAAPRTGRFSICRELQDRTKLGVTKAYPILS